MHNDMLIIGGGLAGASLAGVQARRGVRVLVIERERRFRDRVRGEGLLPWGVVEARRLGIHESLAGACAHEVPWWTVHRGRELASRRNLVETTIHRVGCLGFYHPAMQEALLEAAAQAGAEVRRGAQAIHIERGRRPAVVVRDGRGRETLAADHVVIAGGRHSRLRGLAGFAARQDPARLRITGALLGGMRAPADSVHLLQDPARSGGSVLVYPIGRGQFRVYVVCGPGARRMPRMGPRELRAACLAAGMPADWIEGSEVLGPIATFEGAGSWVEHPHRERVTLVGDAAATTDPSWGCGLALALRDVRVLCERLEADRDWDRAAHDYAHAHDVHHGAVQRIERWMTELFYDVGPAADARRAHALALQREDRTRRLDIIGLGPDAPSDEAARRRFFGEDRARGQDRDHGREKIC